jgi:predicted acylesterase/phospholipase RssA
MEDQMPQLDQRPILASEPRPPANVDLGNPRLGLALSGGGFRASAFHLGTLAALDELGLLSQISNLSTVSGGTIAGVSWLWYRAKHPAAPFQAFRDWVHRPADKHDPRRKGCHRRRSRPVPHRHYLVHSYRQGL